MGGDGGTLNNTRKELQRRTTRAKRAGPPMPASVTHCAVSHEPLVGPVVVDRGGLLYNTPALIAHLLRRRSHPAGDGAAARAFAHVRSLRRDTARVRCGASGGLVCAVTREAARPGFYVRWRCGCVVRKRALGARGGCGCGRGRGCVDGQEGGARKNDNKEEEGEDRDEDEDEDEDEEGGGGYVKLGMVAKDREEALRAWAAQRRREKKRQRTTGGEGARAGKRTRPMSKQKTDNAGAALHRMGSGGDGGVAGANDGGREGVEVEV